eukprot:g1528.t1
MSLTCSLTGRVPFEPVVVRPSGYLYDRNALDARIEETGHNTCPISGTEIDTILPIKTGHAQTLRTIPAANLPGLLTTVQTTYDDLLNASFTQKRDLDSAKEQLQHVLTQHDAATRTIKRILGERDLARSTVKSLETSLREQRKTLLTLAGAASSGSTTAAATTASSSAPTTGAPGSTPPEEVGFSEDWSGRIANYDAEFSKKRKEGAYKEVHKTLTPFATNRNMQNLCAFADRHQSSAPGVTCCALDPANSDEILTGGEDGNLEKFNLQQAQESRKAPATLQILAHESPVTCCGFHPAKSTILYSASKDSTLKLFSKDASGNYAQHFSSSPALHGEAGIVDMFVHPINDLMVTAGGKNISYFDMNTGQLLRWVKNLEDSIQQFKLHPNGKAGIAAVGRQIQLWDIAQGACTRNMGTLNEEHPHSATITAVGVSHNAINVVTGSADGVIHLWDLRKQEQPLQTHVFAGRIEKLRFDPAGQYLGIGHSTDSVEIYHFESKATIAEIASFGQAHRGRVTDLVFADRARFAVSVGMDRVVNFYQAPELSNIAGVQEAGGPDAKRMRTG